MAKKTPTQTRQGGGAAIDKAIAKGMEKEVDFTPLGESPVADLEGDLPDGNEGNSPRQGDPLRRRYDEDGGEAPGMAQKSGKTGKTDKGGKESGPGNINSRRSANSG